MRRLSRRSREAAEADRRRCTELTSSFGRLAAGARSGEPSAKADVAQLAEHVLGKDEVTGSIPVIGSRFDGRSGDAVAIWRDIPDGVGCSARGEIAGVRASGMGRRGPTSERAWRGAGVPAIQTRLQECERAAWGGGAP